MESRQLRNGVALTTLGLGTAQFGNLYRETTDEEATAAVDVAWDAGIRYFDTAPHYGLGLSERRVGAALASRPRDEYVLSTKVGKLLVDSPETADRMDDEGFMVPASVRRRWDFSRDGILRSIEASLDRLGLDRIDIAYLHDADDYWESASTTGVGTLVELRDQGVIRAIGAGMNQSAMLRDFVEKTDVDLVMLAGRYTLLEQGALADVLPAALEKGVGVVAVGVYNSGLLSTDRVPDDAMYDYLPAPRELIDRGNAIADLCERHGVSLPTAALQFPLQHPAVTSVVVGCRNAQQVRGNLDRFAASIPDALWRDLADAGLIPA